MIEKFVDLIPKSVLSKSGKAFYSGRAAFNTPSQLYILGLNPGGNPEDLASETIESHTKQILEREDPGWSAYSDEAWGNAPPGALGLQPRVLHLLRQLNLNPRLTPSSNVIFVRSSREAALVGNFNELAEMTWPFHQAVIDRLGIRVILCFGKTAGKWVTQKVGAHRVVGEFVEMNLRRWRSIAYSNDKGIFVIVATHPSIADWTAPTTDPTSLARQVMRQL